MTPTRSDSEPKVLPVLYAALAAGVLLFAAIVLLVVGPLESRVDRSLLRLVWLAVAVGATLAAGMVRARLSSDFSAQRAHAAAVVVWGLAEGQALLGLVGYLLTGDSLLVALPLALFGYLYLRYPPGAFRGPDRG